MEINNSVLKIKPSNGLDNTQFKLSYSLYLH